MTIVPPASTVMPSPSPKAATASSGVVGIITSSSRLTSAIVQRVQLARGDLLHRRARGAAFARRRVPARPRAGDGALPLAQLEKPLLLEGEAGVGKTEAAKALGRVLDARLIRLQCYEGLDVAHAVYEWNYSRQLLHIRAAQEGTVSEQELFGPEFLIRRPLLEAIESPERVVLLIDEIDRADEEFEAFLLEVLSDFQITIPEIGTISRGRPQAGGRAHVQPHARAPRRSQAPLPLPLDRPSRARARGGDRQAPRPRRPRAARRAGGRLRAGPARARSGQAARRGRDDRLGERARRRSGGRSSTRRSSSRRWARC